MTRTQRQIRASNETWRQKPPHFYREQNCATTSLRRNSLFRNPAPSQRSIKNQNLAVNAVTERSLR